MSFLDQLPEDERNLLVRLPYRVGLFVSHSDNMGGDDSDAAEMQALDDLITGYSQEVFGAETVQYIISETVRRKSEWELWAQDLSNIEEECYRAIDILSINVDEKEVNAFKKHLIEIGESVALAFREYSKSTSFIDKMMLCIFYIKGKAHASKSGTPYKDWEQFINISLGERKALRVIASALNTVYI